MINLRSIFNSYAKLKIELELAKTQKEMLDLQSLIDGDEDLELVELAREELNELKTKEKEFKKKLKSEDPNNIKNAIFEIQAGVGGDESSLFVGDLFRIYEKYILAEKKWKIEVLDFTPGNVGGLKEIAFIIQGKGAYGRFKHESGAHRIQRVPTTESKGRVHTSIATVVVLPETELEDININKADVKMENFSAGGPGGQNVNKNHCAVRLTHEPTGISATSRTKSLQANLKFCWKTLATKIADHFQQQKDQSETSEKRKLRGKGLRNEKIRTYNFPQNRVTDHRIKKNYSVNKIIEGDITNLLDTLNEELD